MNAQRLEEASRLGVWFAGNEGHWDVVKLLLEKDPSRIYNTGGRNESSLAFPAIEQGELEILKYLVEKGVDLNQEDDTGCNALCCAVSSGRLEIIKYLVEDKKMDVNAQSSLTESTALHSAAWRTNLDVVKYLLSAGASLDLKNDKGRTPVEEAILSGQQQIYEYLVAESKKSKTATSING